MKQMTFIWVGAVVAFGCGQGNLDLEPRQEEPRGHQKQGEAWSSADNPSLFAASLEFKLDALPLTGQAATTPWAGSYWPTYQDNINYRWDGQGSDSPAKKYELAFGGSDVEGM